MNNINFIISLFSVLAIMGCSKDSSNGDSPKNGNIKFEDEVAKARIVKYFDLNSDGELSYSEAAAVTDLDPFYYHLEDIKYLDELKFFTGITYFHLGAYCEKLERVSIPKNVTYVDVSDEISIYSYPKLKRITCYPTTPPENLIEAIVDGSSLDYYAHLIYVPKSALGLYKETIKKELIKWNCYTSEEIDRILDRIKGL